MFLEARTTRLLVLSILISALAACSLTPLKGYPGPNRPKSELALIYQTDFLESRPIYMRKGDATGGSSIRLDKIGVAVLPGSYAFWAELYHYTYREVARLTTVDLYPGESSFPFQEPQLQRVREETPYKVTEAVEWTVERGCKCGLWCNEKGKIYMSVTGSH